MTNVHSPIHAVRLKYYLVSWIKTLSFSFYPCFHSARSSSFINQETMRFCFAALLECPNFDYGKNITSIWNASKGPRLIKLARKIEWERERVKKCKSLQLYSVARFLIKFLVKWFITPYIFGRSSFRLFVFSIKIVMVLVCRKRIIFTEFSPAIRLKNDFNCILHQFLYGVFSAFLFYFIWKW